MYFKKNKKSLIMLAAALGTILVSSFFGSLIQSRGWTIEVSDLRDVENEGVLYNDAGEKVLQPKTDKNGNPVLDSAGNPVMEEVEVLGEVKSGILYMPKKASETNKLPAVVLTHGYLNNREHQLPNAVELARRGFIVLTVDREGHGNYENEHDQGAMMATRGLYESAKYLYNLPEVDKTRVGISGHSMGGFTTAMTLVTDMRVGIVSAALIQGWSSFMGAAPDVSVGILKAKDDEFFFTSKDVNGEPTICRQYLQSQGAASFVGDNSWRTTGVIDIEDGGVYVSGTKVAKPENGQAVGSAFRAVYESKEIHPLNHFSTESTASVVEFFYNAFGTPNGFKYIKPTNQVWTLKEAMATIGWAGIIFMIFPLIQLLLGAPVFAELRKRRLETTDGRIVYEDVDEVAEAKGKVPLKGLRKHLSFWIPAVACTLFAGFSISPIQQWAGDVIEKTALLPQDTTGWVALWSICCGLFALTMVLVTNLVNRVINAVVYKEEAEAHNENPFEVVRIGSVSRFLKTVLLAVIVVVAMYLVLFINWAIWKVDFRFWTFCMKVFEVDVMLPTILRYAALFGIFYVCNAICNQTYRASNLPEWATIAINAAFNIFGIALVFAIQYITFTSTGVLWKQEMNLAYIVLFPIIPVLICATIISRITFKKTGNIWLGALINTLLWTIVTVSGTAASFGLIFG